jgi:hypothetical protein
MPKSNCVICGKEFKFNRYDRQNARFCSLKCKGVGLKKPLAYAECKQCHIKFEVANHRLKSARFCNHKCYSLFIDGIEKPSFWETASFEEKINRLKKSFEKYVIKKEGCWDWKGCPSKPYGSLQYGGKYKAISAHRASWIAHNKKEIPTGMFVCHSCDNRRCTNPDHLFLGTAQDNVIDMINKGRNNPPKGEASHQSKLSEKQVREIIILLKSNTMTSISEDYGVDIVTIHDIKHKKTWKHLHHE